MSAPKTGTSTQPRTLAGTLAKTPVPRLLVSASTARVTGTLEIKAPGESATLVMARGQVTRIRTSAPVAYLGSILYELGYIESDELNSSLRELARTKWLHGEILLTRGVISPAQVAEGLHEQTARKLVHLFSLPPETAYAFEADVDQLATYGGADFPSVDPVAAVWRGIRDGFAHREVQDALSRVREFAFRLASVADPRRFDLSEGELTAIDCLRARALTEEELVQRSGLDAARARALLYFLLITRQAEPTDVTGVRQAYRSPVSAAPYAPDGSSSARGAAEPPPHLRPTVREMSAVGSSPRISVAAPEMTESGKWRAVGSSGSSARVPVAAPQASESGTMPVSRGTPPTTQPPRITIGGIQPTKAKSTTPPRRSGLTPAQEWMVSDYANYSPPADSRIPVAPRVPSTAPPRSSGPVPAGARRSTTPVPSPAVARRSLSPHPSTSTLNSKVINELAARRQSLFERARAIVKEDYFQRLGLARDATPEQVDLSFQALQTLWDPGLLPPALEEAREDAAFVMTCLGEAHATLRDVNLRAEYASHLAAAVLRAPPEQIEEDLAVTGAATHFEGAQIAFARNELDRAERLCKRAHKLDAEAGGPLALLAWLQATKPQNVGAEETRRRVLMLDRALRLDDTMAEAFHWRGQLHKRLENHAFAIRDFKRVVELEPKHLEAIRELRVYEMRIRRNSISMKAVKP